MSILIPTAGQTWRRIASGAEVTITSTSTGRWAGDARVHWTHTDDSHAGSTIWDAFTRRYEPVLPVNVGEVWRRKSDSRQVRVIHVHANDPRAAGQYLDLTIWWEHAGPSKGGPWRVGMFHWLNMYERVTESAGGDAA